MKQNRTGTPRLAFVLGLLLVLVAVAWAQQGHAAGRRQDLVAHGSGDRFWIARVSVGSSRDGAQVRTDVYVRSFSESRWQPVTTVESRVVAMAHRGPQLALLLDDGAWLLVSEQAVVTGRAPPGGGQILDLASDRDTLLALVRLRTTPSAAPATTAPASPHRVALFSLSPNGWIEHADLAPAVADPWAEVSLAVVETTPLVAVREAERKGRVRLVRPAPDRRGWVDAGAVEPRNDAVFKLLGGGSVPVLWALGREGGYSLHWFGREGVQELDVPPPQGVDPNDTAAAFAFERVRVLYTSGGRRYERTYDAIPTASADAATTAPATAPAAGATGTPPATGPANEDTRILLPARPLNPRVTQWLQPLLSVALLFTIIASIRRRREMQDTMSRSDRLPLAPAGRRLAAGVIDAVPLLAAAAVLTVRQAQISDPVGYWEDPTVQVAVVAGALTYLLHTTITEMFLARTLGKMALGLRVVALDGTRPTTGALLTRNLLRVIDLLMAFFPLVLVLYSPLRQRAGDVAAGTLVILNDEQGEAEKVEEEEKEKAAAPVEVAD